jgi:DNA-binding transcriptional MerR regulator
MVEHEGNKFPVAEVRRMIRMFNELKAELKEDIQKQLNESQENMDKKLEKTQKQLNEMKEDVNKL